uniref:Uncharacterized protein n=1 Tax=Vitis vinifera TaxID=29760 RepID=A5ADD8_VITVI|nr:hypothetical protein VITISV_023244 [Vitis vinifera]
MGVVGSSLKIATWLPFPCDTWYRSFHPDEEFSLITPGHLTSGSGRRSTFSGYLTFGSGQRSTLFECLTAAILFDLYPTFFGYLTAAILSGRRSTFSGYFTSGACRRMGEGDDSTSPGRHVWILR